jgi:hypothetical protein
VIRLIAICCLLAGSALAHAPDQSLRPQIRTVFDPAAAIQGEALAESLTQTLPRTIVYQSERPQDRPEAILIMGRRAAEERRRGAVCGDLDIQGDSLGNVPGNGACGVEDAVRVRMVAGVRLTAPATIDCNTARALKTWVEQGVIPAVGNEGGGVENLRVVAHFACRTRNNRPGARLSEHSFGRAVDIAGIGLRNGSEISVLNGWGTSADGAQLRQMHRAACGPFGTVLGPESDRYHQDHFHFDTAQYRSGSYCR